MLPETPIEKIPRMNANLARKLHRLGIKTARDLLFHFPFRYDDFTNVKKIADVKIGEVATVRAVLKKITSTRAWKKRLFLAEAIVEDDTGTARVVWFNQPYLAKTFHPGEVLSISGKLTKSPKGAYFANPAYERVGRKEELTHTAGLVPVYPETAALSSRWIRFLVKEILPVAAKISDPLPDNLQRRFKFLPIVKALQTIHFPKSMKDAEEARRRFAFEEILLIQLRVLRERQAVLEKKSPEIPVNLALIKQFVASLPFPLTDAQRKTAWEIVNNTAKPHPMNRLLEGDVGSGKTVVAALVALNAVKAGFQVAYLTPTEILSLQHFSIFKNLLSQFEISIGLLTSNQKKLFAFGGISEKVSISSLASAGEVDIVIGTHAVISAKGGPASGGQAPSLQFKNLGLVIVDEQHRFGVNQRAALIRGSARTGETQTDADKLIHKDITYKIRGCTFQVKDKIGLGHKELVYQKALAEAFKIAGLHFTQEKHIDVFFHGKKVGIYQPDFIVEDQVLVELKALPFLGSTEIKQAWQYAKGSPYKLTLLINFGPQSVTIKRIVYDTARSLRKSALQVESPRESAILIPHFLSMTATPIPRTLALTVYGDLDVSVLDEIPKGRKPIMTRVVPSDKRRACYEFIRKEVKSGRQVFVICPRIEIAGHEDKVHTQAEIFKEEVKAVKTEYEKLSMQIFSDLKIAMLHGKMKPKEKERVMCEFENKKFDILVSTSVVEVGVDIPNATVMLIDGAEKFGLAQIHQFRGRVGRGEHQSYCFLMTTTPEAESSSRLKAVVSAKNGFELAEKDLQIRGPGDFFGTRQSGIPPFAYKSFTDMKLVQSAREAADEIISKDPKLEHSPELKKRLEEFEASVHFE